MESWDTLARYSCSYLGSHGFSTFFNDFKTINMKILLVLNLEKNNISSIELIQHLDAPNLDCIYLHGNPIVSIKSFRKARFPKLTRLYISNLLFYLRWLRQWVFVIISMSKLESDSKCAQDSLKIPVEKEQYCPMDSQNRVSKAEESPNRAK